MDLVQLKQLAREKALLAGYTEGLQQAGFTALWGPVFQFEMQHQLWLDERHANPEGFVHGGLLSAMADYVMYQGAQQATVELHTPTVDMQLQFLAPAQTGTWLVGRSQILRQTRSLLFMRAELVVNDNVILAAMALYKLVAKKHQAK